MGYGPTDGFGSGVQTLEIFLIINMTFYYVFDFMSSWKWQNINYSSIEELTIDHLEVGKWKKKFHLGATKWCNNKY
jgi:hypothetical protein